MKEKKKKSVFLELHDRGVCMLGHTCAKINAIVWDVED